MSEIAEIMATSIVYAYKARSMVAISPLYEAWWFIVTSIILSPLVRAPYEFYKKRSFARHTNSKKKRALCQVGKISDLKTLKQPFIVFLKQ